MTSTLTDTRDLGALGGPLAGLSFVAGVAVTVATGAASSYPRPGSTTNDIQSYFNRSSTTVRLSVAGQLIASIALIPFTASVANLTRQTVRGSDALLAAVIAGGGSAVVTLAASAFISAALTYDQPDRTMIRMWHNTAFVAGGPLHTVGLGVLVGALGLAGLRSRELPRSLAVACLVAAPLAILSPLALAAQPTRNGQTLNPMVSSPASPLSVTTNPALLLIPSGRFSALILIGIAGIWLARRSR